MRLAFWASTAIIAYTYLGYAGWLWLRSRWFAKPVKVAPYKPFISIVMVVRNEASALDGKVRNLLALDYPSDLREIVIASDGSTDGTNEILSEYAKRENVRVILSSEARGKAAGINDAVAAARGEIIVFNDARQKIEPDAVRLLVENFADPTVGCASGNSCWETLIPGKP